jgi:ABC-type glycerol-3-phosphate transport system substrate-binding protein
MMIMGADSLSWLASMGMNVEDIGLAPFPKGPTGNRTASISGASFIVNPRISKQKQDAAWEYIKWVTSKDYLTNYLRDMEKNQVINPIIIERSDVKTEDIINIDQAWMQASEEAIRWSRDEFYGKSVVGKYVNRAVQRIISDSNADPGREFKEAEELAGLEVQEFNSSIKR